MVHLLPLLSYLRNEWKLVDVYAMNTNYEVATILQRLWYIRCVYRIDSFRDLFKSRLVQYDYILDSEQFFYFGSILSLWMYGTSIGFDTNERRMLYSGIVWYSQEMYEASSFIRLLEIFGVKTPTIFPDIQIDTLTSLLPSTLKWTESILNTLPVVGKRLVIHTGAAKLLRTWPIQAWQMLLPLVAPYFSHIVSIGGQNTCTDDIKLSTTGLSSFFPLSGKTSILETLLILKKSHFLISNDTGTLHLWVLVGVPKIAGIFGPWIAQKWAGDRVVVLRSWDLSCIGCNYGRFSQTPPCSINFTCLKNLEAQKVFFLLQPHLHEPS